MAAIIKTGITVNQPVELVWEAFMNPANLQHWLTGFVSATPVLGMAGEPGSLTRVVFKERGKEITFIEKAVLVNRPRQYRFEMEHKTMKSENDFRFISFGHYTEIIETVRFFPKSFLMKLLLPLIKGTLKKTIAGDLFNLKKMIEDKNQ